MRVVQSECSCIAICNKKCFHSQDAKQYCEMQKLLHDATQHYKTQNNMTTCKRILRDAKQYHKMQNNIIKCKGKYMRCKTILQTLIFPNKAAMVHYGIVHWKNISSAGFGLPKLNFYIICSSFISSLVKSHEILGSATIDHCMAGPLLVNFLAENFLETIKRFLQFNG